jgi:VanZ family protein
VKDKTFRVIHQDQEFGLISSRVKGLDWGGLLWYWLPLVVYSMAIICISSISVPEREFAVFLHSVNSLFPADGEMFRMSNDKLYHITEYAILAVLTYRAFRYTWKDQTNMTLGLLALGAVILFGCSDELYQWFTPLRYSNVWDLTADAFGGIMGVCLWEVALSISMIRLLEERIPLKLQVALGIQALKL